ncbi:hypothetical protein CYMTET_26890 [Cymbomonas tetramitiformis]|uniref:Uncharacterized protein n=1 Tax=Cymbomonas tetramitiformis TaxID=36881 RepID=A0AAE0FQU5_9CHLO|nr:hypothetical protein CYMTET_26890 [Cymbomonas tetramitiformis]
MVTPGSNAIALNPVHAGASGEVLEDKAIPSIANEFWKVLQPSLRSFILRSGASPMWMAHRAGLDRNNICTRPMPDFKLRRGQCRKDGEDHPGPKDPPDDIPHSVDIIMGKGQKKKKEAETLLRSISGTAVEWATKMLISDNKAEKEMASKKSKKPP